MIYGVHPVQETVRAGRRRVEEIYLARGHSQAPDLVTKIQDAGFPVTHVSANEIISIAGSPHHQGVAARVGAFPYADFTEILSSHETVPGPILILDEVQDPANLGSVIRSAECLGAMAIVIAKDRSVPLTPAVEKAAAGASAHMRIVRVVNLVRAITQLKNSGFWVYGTHQHGQDTIYSADLTGKTAFVLGSEGRGMRRLVRETCDNVVSIPMVGHVESLNVSQTATIVLAETLRQRLMKNVRND